MVGPPRRRKPPDPAAAERIVADAQRQRAERERGYRAQALRLLPPVCARCGRGFSGARLGELTVHHKDHDHDHNPPDGSNWELLCRICHDAEHGRAVGAAAGAGVQDTQAAPATHRPFADLLARLKRPPDDDA